MALNASNILARFRVSYPVKVIPVAKEFGISVYVSDDMADNISGMIKKDVGRGGDSGYAIFVNDRHANVRKRFTIAHEIGHYVLHKDLIGDGIVEDALLRATGLTNSIERQANAFAADLLMPWALLEQATVDGFSSIEAMADAFEVSNDAMSYRVLGSSYQQAVSLGKA